MDFLAIVQAILRGIALSSAILITVIYIAAQLFQRIPTAALGLKLYDYIVLGLVALLASLGLNSYWGFLAFIPLLLWKLLAKTLFDRKRIRGKGRWLEVRWCKFPPKGFSNVSREAIEQLNRELARLPKDTHFVIPRPVGLWVVRYLLKRSKKQTQGGIPQLRGREQESFQKLEEMANSIVGLEKEKTKTINLPFGVLHISRL
jgi:hypothetical protein